MDKRRKVYKGELVTESQWQLIELAISTFIKTFPLQWINFQDELAQERKMLDNPVFADLDKKQHKGLEARGFRKMAVIPTFWNEVKQQEESLIMVLDKISPNLFTNKQNTREFLKRFPSFKVPDKI